MPGRGGQTGRRRGKERLAQVAAASGNVATAFDEPFGIQPEELFEIAVVVSHR